MSLFQAIFLGFVQGLTEFLPISSSGHLVFFQSLFKLNEPPIFFDVMLHLGTLLAVVIYFWKDIWKITEGIGSALKGKEGNREGLILFLWIILATIPTGLMGILFKDWFESFFSEPKLVGGRLILTGLVLWLTRFAKKEGKPLGRMVWYDAILIASPKGLPLSPEFLDLGQPSLRDFFVVWIESLLENFPSCSPYRLYLVPPYWNIKRWIQPQALGLFCLVRSLLLGWVFWH